MTSRTYTFLKELQGLLKEYDANICFERNRSGTRISVGICDFTKRPPNPEHYTVTDVKIGYVDDDILAIDELAVRNTVSEAKMKAKEQNNDN